MKLQKLLFYAYGWWLAYRPDPFMREKPEVWRYGPVFSSVYWTFNHYGSSPIIESEKDNPFVDEPPRIPDADVLAHQFIRWISSKYGDYDSLQLSDMTHQPGTPWQLMAEKYNYRVPKHLEIDDAVTRSYFQRLVQKETSPA